MSTEEDARKRLHLEKPVPICEVVPKQCAEAEEEPPPLAGPELMALLNQPNKAWEMWQVVTSKYGESLDKHRSRQGLQEEVDLLGLMGSPEGYLNNLHRVRDYKAALLILHDQNPKLDMEHLAEVDDLVVAWALLSVMNRLPVEPRPMRYDSK